MFHEFLSKSWLCSLPLNQASINLAKLHCRCLSDIVPMIFLGDTFFRYLTLELPGLHPNFLAAIVLFPFQVILFTKYLLYHQLDIS